VRSVHPQAVRVRPHPQSTGKKTTALPQRA